MKWNTDHIECVAVSAARKDFASILERASDLGIRVGLTRHGQPIAGVVPFSDVATLEAIDDRAVELADVQEAGVGQPHWVLQGKVDRFADYVTGQIDARLADSKLVKDPALFAKIQSIVSQSIHASLDPSILPNPPEGIVQVAETVETEGTPEVEENTEAESAREAENTDHLEPVAVGQHA